MPDQQKQNPITAIAETNFRSQRRRFGTKRADRRAHMYIIGKTCTGKSTLTANLADQDLRHREGFALLDPHGEMAEQVLRLVPDERQSDLIHFNVPDTTHPRSAAVSNSSLVPDAADVGPRAKTLHMVPTNTSYFPSRYLPRSLALAI